MKVLLVTLDSMRYDSIPSWFIVKHKPTVFINARTYYAGTIPALTSFFTGVAPVIHGVGSHHRFYKAKLKRKSIFDILAKEGIEAAFASNEELMSYMQCVRMAKRITIEDVGVFLNKHDPCFVAAHIFHPTHAPYGSDEIMQKIEIGRKSEFKHWKDEEFLIEARKQQLKQIESVFRSIDALITEFPDVYGFVSADHGEAFGEENMWGHEQMFIDVVMRIPLLELNKGKVFVDEVVYPSYVYKKILSLFGLIKKPAHQMVVAENLRKFWEKRGVGYHSEWSEFGYLTSEHKLILLDLLRLAKSKNVLELGCGAGRVSAICTDGYVGVDFSKNMLYHAKHHKHPDREYVLADVHHLPFREDSFDCIMCCEVLQHIKDLDMVIEGLKPIAKFFICLEHYETMQVRLSEHCFQHDYPIIFRKHKYALRKFSITHGRHRPAAGLLFQRIEEEVR